MVISSDSLWEGGVKLISPPHAAKVIIPMNSHEDQEQLYPTPSLQGLHHHSRVN